MISRRGVVAGLGLPLGGSLDEQGLWRVQDGGRSDMRQPPAGPPADAGPHARDLLRNGLKDKLARGEVAASMSVRLVRSPEIAQLASAAGFDAFYVEMQHSSFTEAEISRICQAAIPLGITALVRVPSVRPEHVGRILDGGALGVIAPEIQSVEEVRRAVQAAKFPPMGDRSAPGAQLFQLRYRPFPTEEAYAALNEATMVVVMLENVEALDKVEQIAAVDGLDMLFVGTSDLTNSMRIPGQPGHEEKLRFFLRLSSLG